LEPSVNVDGGVREGNGKGPKTPLAPHQKSTSNTARNRERESRSESKVAGARSVTVPESMQTRGRVQEQAQEPVRAQ